MLQDNKKTTLTPIFCTEIPALYGADSNKVWLHQDKASSHTSASTHQFLKNMERETGIYSIPFSDIPVKSSDVSRMDFCAFGLLKRAFESRIPRTVGVIWKSCQEEWNKMDTSVLRISLLQWKLRCRAIIRTQVHQLEHHRWWRCGFS